MFFELIAAIAAAFAGAGLVLLLNMLTRGALPKWAMPVAAGAAMLGYAVWSEYTWYARTAGDLPAGVEVTTANEVTAFWRPWTYMAPLVDRFAALDTASIQTNDAVPDQRIADLYFFGRWSPQRALPVVIDCSRGLVAPLPSATLDEAGAATDAAWGAPADGDATLDLACT
ncbi:MAG: hypothetical protein AAFR47_21935 [Pseudomonadota bacterium]